MNDDAQINIFRCLDWIRDNAAPYAQAKADRIYLENFRKSKKSLCMRDAELHGHKTAAMQEREAYADPEYITVLEALKAAVEKEETLRWMMVSAEAKIECWRTIESTRRAEARTL
jgi:hypothetical protein